MRAVIYFDGGTSCNSPRIGFGEGYGSFKVAGGPINRVKHGPGHSNNSAEVRTLIAALRDAKAAGYTAFHIVGDSQITLRRCRNGKKPATGSQNFKDACETLLRELAFCTVTTQWVPRDRMVEMFGH